METMAMKTNAQRLNLVFHTYQDNSFKSATREDRTMGVKIVFNEEDMLPNDMKDFLLDDEIKRNFYEIVQKQAASPIFWKWPGEVTTTLGKRVWTPNDGAKDFVRWQDEVHEEADHRMLAHVKDVIESSFGTKILIRASDTDVVVLIVAFFEQFIQYNEDVDIWIDFGSGDHRRFISINRSYNLIGDSINLGLQFFHAFSGCDSSFNMFILPQN